jgi:hypothetical protein
MKTSNITKYSNSITMNIVMCISIARQQVGKQIPATHAHVTIGHPLLGNGPVNMPP